MAGLPESTGATHVQPKGWGLPAANPEKAAQQEAQAAKITPPAVQQTTVGGAFAAAFGGKNGAAEAPSVTVLAMPSPPPAQTFEEHRAQLAQKVETANAATAEVAPKRTRKVAEAPTPSAPLHSTGLDVAIAALISVAGDPGVSAADRIQAAEQLVYCYERNYAHTQGVE